MDYSNAFVCLMGVGTVFFGLACLIGLVYLLSWLCRDRKTAVPVLHDAAPAAIGNRQEMVAAISAVLAEELGTDITGIRILSIKKL